MSFLPAEYLWLQPVLVASIAVFVISFVGNLVFFGNKFFNALVTAIIFGLVFAALVHFDIAGINVAAIPATAG